MRLESDTGDHVAYSQECDGDEHNECFEFACPSSHPVRMPEIHLYVRVLGYEVSQVGQGLSMITSDCSGRRSHIL